GGRSHDFAPALVFVDLVHLAECVVDIRDRGDQRSTQTNRPGPRLPVEWIAPRVPLISRATRCIQSFEKVYGSAVVLVLAGGVGQKGKSHRVMCIRDREPLTLPE